MISTAHSAMIVAVCALVTAGIRFLPFIIFPENKELPPTLVYLSKVLPAAIMGMLLVYCFRNTKVLTAPFALPELIASAVVIILYVWKKNFLVSIGAGTVLYMVLVQTLFAVH